MLQLMFFLMLCMMWFLVLWHYLWLWLRGVRLEGGVWIGGGAWGPKVAHWVRVETAGGRSFGLAPWIGLYNRVDRWTLEHGTFVLWALKLWTFHWWALELRAFKRWHHSHWVLVHWMSLHTTITRVPRTTTPLQFSDSFMRHLVERFVHQTVQESWAFLTPGTLVVLSFHVRCCPILHSEGHRLFNNIGAVILVSAGGFPWVVVLTSFILVILQWSVEFCLNHRQK